VCVCVRACACASGLVGMCMRENAGKLSVCVCEWISRYVHE
jgi:hypothetical protein